MRENPLVSVITATYNMGKYVCQAVDSVLAQDYPAIEVIVVDDGSTDDTPRVLSKYENEPRVRVIRQANGGQTVAKNRGLREARGEYIGFCDADNRWLPHKLSRQIPVFGGGDNVGVVYGDVQLIDAEGKELPTPDIKRYSGRITGKLLVDNFVTFNTTLVPRRIIEEAGGFDESLRMGIDYDLWLRLSVTHEFLHLPEPLVQYRIWGGQMSNKMGERFDNCFRLMDRFLERYPGSVTPAEARRGWAHTHVSRGQWHTSRKDYRMALRDYVRAARYRFHDLRLWKSVARLVLGR